MNSTLRKCLAVLALGTILGAGLQAQVYTNVYVDDFSQFAGGTLLASNNFATNYVPTAGFGAYITNDNPGPLTGSIYATNLSGNVGAWWDVPTNSSFNYSGFFNQPASNIGTRVTFEMGMLNTNAALGGAFTVGMTSTNNANSTRDLLAFLDTGIIVVFTNAPSLTTYMQVGAFDPNVLHTNRVDYNLFLDTYNVFVDGTQIVTNQAIPSYLDTNAIQSLSFSYDNTLSTFGNSNPNQIFLDNVIFAIPEPTALFSVGLGLAALLWRRRRA